MIEIEKDLENRATQSLEPPRVLIHLFRRANHQKKRLRNSPVTALYYDENREHVW